MKKTLIGVLPVGIIILVIGIYFLADGFTFKTLEINEIIPPNNSKTYTIYARNHAVQLFNITGSQFDLNLHTPLDGLKIPTTTHINPVNLSWTHLDDGVSNVFVNNTDTSDLSVGAILTTTTDVSLLKYYLIMIIIGVGIIGLGILKTKQSASEKL